MIKSIGFFALFQLIAIITFGQADTIKLRNPSFEDAPKQGGVDPNGISGWFDCGKINFPIESPPDIHPNGFWENNLPASDRKTYLGMVVRDNGTYESVSSRLDTNLTAGKCYKFTLHLARAPRYISATRLEGKMANYNTPVVLRIWGGAGYCNEKELLAESAPVSNDSWQINTFEFSPKNNIRSITFQAYYKTPVLMPYNGNILVDGGSEIIRIACPGEPPLIAKNKSKLPPHKRKKDETKSNQSTGEIVNSNSPTNSYRPKILHELNRTSIKAGQTIEIKKLEFKADTTSIDKTSYEVLDEVYGFMMNNPDVMIEIGGHTNSMPPDDYCDRLSTARAKAVAEYLVNKGVEANKVQFKGYGKKKPVADNKTAYGRQKNQRVEIKILSLNS
ncbi:MAG: OmpA family protein [Saprospiraceae bacterium]|nr:OmpA family protein [Saprospiraceae bacterium]